MKIQNWIILFLTSLCFSVFAGERTESELMVKSFENVRPAFVLDSVTVLNDASSAILQVSVIGSNKDVESVAIYLSQSMQTMGYVSTLYESNLQSFIMYPKSRSDCGIASNS